MRSNTLTRVSNNPGAVQVLPHLQAARTSKSPSPSLSPTARLLMPRVFKQTFRVCLNRNRPVLSPVKTRRAPFAPE